MRSQATVVFFDVFPLKEDNASAESDEKNLQRQFDLLTSLLKDEDHRVRTNAVTGVCSTLKEHWGELPSTTTRTILTYLVSTLGHDTSCSNVRQAVFDGIRLLLTQPRAHGVLKGLLPVLSNSIHDNAEAVS